jgi:hypothetical protein
VACVLHENERQHVRENRENPSYYEDVVDIPSDVNVKVEEDTYPSTLLLLSIPIHFAPCP